MINKVFLFDMDGVILKNPMYTKSIQTRVHSFVKKKLDRYMSDRKVEQINKVLYKDFGHTIIGMNKIYNLDVTLEEFSNYVYDKKFLNEIHFVNEEEMAFKNFVKACFQKDQQIYIFSNAPDIWCNRILESMNITDIPIIGCDHFIYHPTDNAYPALKPNLITYMKVMQFINSKDMFKKHNFIMIDDQIKNLIPIIDHPEWRCVWMNNDKSEYQICTQKLYTIHDIDQLHSFI